MPDQIFHPKIIKDNNSDNSSEKSTGTKWLFDIEDRGRTLATKIQNNPFSNDIVYDVFDFLKEIKSALDFLIISIPGVAPYDKVDSYLSFIDVLGDTRYIVQNAISGCKGNPINRYDPVTNPTPPAGGGYIIDGKCYAGGAVEGSANYIDIASKDATGSSCMYFVKTREGRISLASIINGITSCFHRLITDYDSFITEGKTKIYRCTIDDGSNEALITACAEWSKTVDFFNQNQLYTAHDVGAVRGKVFDNHAEFRVGDSPGHMTHFSLNDGTLEYYDTDAAVNRIMANLFNDVGLDCSIRNDGVTCTGLTEQNVVEVVRRLAAATSMDYRTRLEWKDIDYWSHFVQEHPEAEKCFKFSDIEDQEVCLVKEKINQFMKG